MNIFEIFLIAIGLAMDAFAVSIGLGGCHTHNNNSRHLLALKAALFFGIFQAGMPVIGWAGGKQFISYIQAIDHWIAFFLLLIIGVKMIFEGVYGQEEHKSSKTSFKTMLILAVATSIDALAVGITFSLLQIKLLFSIFIIGITTFILSYIGVDFGCRFGDKLGKLSEICGGIILIGLGTKILIEHTFFT